jgi:hypothetical protein
MVKVSPVRGPSLAPGRETVQCSTKGEVSVSPFAPLAMARPTVRCRLRTDRVVHPRKGELCRELPQMSISGFGA